ncbi:MAG: hypothetical protein IKF97_07015 [Clostridia bacterium]|nr:hypothetical protein [Clostridia bacterium]
MQFINKNDNIMMKNIQGNLNVRMNNNIEIEIEGMGRIKFEKLIDNNKNLTGMPIKNSKYLKTITYMKLEKLLDNNYVFSLLPKRNKIRLFETIPINLISKYRYDVFIKYYYVQAYITKNNYELAKKIYLNHIKSFNNFKEPDGRKNNAKDYIQRFNNLIDSIRHIGINKTIIPVTKNGEIIDGAHRLSIALYLDIKIQFVIFDLLDTNYSKDFFVARGFNLDYAKIIDKEVVKKFK